MSLHRAFPPPLPKIIRRNRGAARNEARSGTGRGRLLPTGRTRVGLALAACVAFAAPLLASPSLAFAGPFPIEETFQNYTLGPTWRIGGSAELTAKTAAEDGTGWMRLTAAANNEFGYVYDNEAFPSTEGAMVEYEYADYGGTGADGMSFFLFNGTVEESEFHAGDSGGSLGYASCPTEGAEGLSKAYVGVGFDEYGNFTNLGEICGLDGTTMHPNYVTVRGSEEESYKMLAGASVATSQSLRAERSEARHVTITVTPEDKLDVYVQYPNGEVQTVTENFQLPKEHEPSTLKFGYVASTGGSTDYHEVRYIKVAKPTEITTKVEKTNAAQGREEELTWTATIENEGPNESSSETIATTTGGQTLTGVTWTCEAEGGATCPATEGSGMVNASAGAMPIGAKLIYKLKGTAPKPTSYAQMTIEAEPTGEGGEMNPAYEQDTVTTELTPEFTSEPTFTLSSSGLAQATPGVADGGPGVTYAYHWQRCSPAGTECSDITGAEAITYQTTEADREHTIRFEQTATDSAASTTVYTSPYEPLPTETITKTPAEHTASTSATFAFSTATSEATFECAIDAEAWEPCTSEKTYSGLGEGSHTFRVRAVYGGLSDASPASYEWTVEATAPPKLTFTEEPAAISPSSTGKFAFGEVQAGGTIECSLDAGAFAECSNPQEFTGLSEGEHVVQARQKNKAGLTSEAIKYTWTVETAVPQTPTITNEPAEHSSTTTAKFEFGSLKAGDTLECAIDGAEWKPCASPLELTGLSEGAHEIAVRQTSKSGVHSEEARYAWHVETAAPAAPTPISTPEVETTSSSAHFVFSHESGTTVECSIDGGAYAPCTSGLTVGGLSEGWHTISVRQVSLAGVASAPVTYRWHVGKKATPPTTKPTTLSAKLGAHATAQGDRAVKVGCRLSGGEMRRCTVTAYHEVHKHRVEVGRGTLKMSKQGGTGGVVDVHLNARGRHLLDYRLGGLAVTLHTSAATYAGHELKAKSLKARLYAQRVLLIPIVWPFETARSRLVGQAERIVKGAAREIRGAHAVTCIGYTDSRGGGQYNVRLGLRRAKAVCAALKRLGVHARFKVESRGEGSPRATNRTAAGRARNRRVELRVRY